MMGSRLENRNLRLEVSRRQQDINEKETIAAYQRPLLSIGGVVSNRALQRMLIQRDTGWTSDRST